ncbi:hypothetical protein JMJ55_05810 [Belnapia sp. T6]|uniref:DUF2783 domain-containing protein n=1 Tax=Belnapia mucosa TaxID=2804532 RepID=A0ABS1UZE7_9PROT|nr:hypothetical protein [Belnapia mucosa]MBL6454830.1 hypothetical protein [Belnapia mucosa]
MSMEEAALETLWEELAEAVTAAGPERERLFLAKLALLLGREVGDLDRVRAAVAVALRDLE